MYKRQLLAVRREHRTEKFRIAQRGRAENHPGDAEVEIPPDARLVPDTAADLDEETADRENLTHGVKVGERAVLRAVQVDDVQKMCIRDRYYYEGLPASKIAQITGDSVGAVRQQLSRARKQMRERLKEDFLNE